MVALNKIWFKKKWVSFMALTKRDEERIEAIAKSVIEPFAKVVTQIYTTMFGANGTGGCQNTHRLMEEKVQGMEVKQAEYNSHLEQLRKSFSRFTWAMTILAITVIASLIVEFLKK